ncbi:uncharacterized protein DMENIID0001_084360 [Sergentomyia squamirostris]
MKIIGVIFLATVFCVILVSAYPPIDNNETLDVDDDIKYWEIDRECAMVGGVCVHQDDCEHTTSTPGLCPTNKHYGVECCYKLRDRVTTCRKQLGACMDRCNINLQRSATDCPNQVCCVLV